MKVLNSLLVINSLLVLVGQELEFCKLGKHLGNGSPWMTVLGRQYRIEHATNFASRELSRFDGFRRNGFPVLSGLRQTSEQHNQQIWRMVGERPSNKSPSFILASSCWWINWQNWSTLIFHLYWDHIVKQNFLLYCSTNVEVITSMEQTVTDGQKAS